MLFRILGPLEAIDEGVEIDLGSREDRVVLAVLLLDRGSVVPTDLLAGAVWGHELPPDAGIRIADAIGRLRTVLGNRAVLHGHPKGFRLDVPAEEVDRTAFLDAAAAARSALEQRDWQAMVTCAETGLALWRGPLLAGLEGLHRARTEGRRLDERRAELREAQITGLLGLGRLEEAIRLAEALRRDDPLREHACWLQMLGLYRAGRASQALEVFHEHARMLRNEFGLEPAPDVRDLRIAILRQAPGLLRWPGEPEDETEEGTPEEQREAPLPAPDPGPPPLAPPHLAEGDFVGRADERAAVCRVAIRTKEGAARWLVLTGPAGIGKTRLAEEALVVGRERGYGAVRASCPEDEGAPSWWPVRQIVRALGGDPDVVLTTAPGIDADTARFAVYDRLDELVRSAVTRPMILLFDDLQWVDGASARWLTHLAGTVYNGALTVILTLRDDSDENPELERLIAAVARHPGTVHLAVSPMVTDEVGELVSVVAGEEVAPEEAERIEHLTGGNPFFITELARLPFQQRAQGGVPLAVSAVLKRRLGTVSSAVLSVLRAAAVAGDPMDVDLLGTVLGLDRDRLGDLLGEAADHHLVVPTSGGSYAFAHDLLRREVLDGIPAPRRALLHSRIAAALQTGGGASADVLTRRASHLLAAAPLADPAEVLEACRAAARDADHRWQSESAAHWWQAALDAFDRVPGNRLADSRRDDLLVNRVASLARAGRRSEVMEAVDAAVADAVRGGRTTSAARLAGTLLRTAGAWPWSFGTDPGPLPARLAAIEPMVAHDPPAHARVLAALAAGRFDDESGLADRLSGRALEIAERLADNEVLADALLGRALAFAGIAVRAEESIRLLDRLLRLDHRLRRNDSVLAHTLLTMALFTVGDLDGVEEHFRLGVAGADALRLPISRVQLRWMEATIAVWHGQLDRAERMIDHAFELHRRTELYVPRVHALATMILRWEQGRIHELDPMPVGDEGGSPLTVAARAMAAGRFDVSDRILDVELARPQPERWRTHAELALLAHVIADVGDTKHARAVLGHLTPFARFIATAGRVGVVGPVSLAMARLFALLGENESARAGLAQAMQIAERTHGVCSALRCRLLSAQLDGADPGVFTAIALEAEALGMRQVAAQAREHALAPAA